MKRVAAVSVVAFLIGVVVLVERELRGLCRAAADTFNVGRTL